MQKKQKNERNLVRRKHFQLSCSPPFLNLSFSPFSQSLSSFRTMGRGLSQRRRVANVLKARQVSGIASTNEKREHLLV